MNFLRTVVAIATLALAACRADTEQPQTWAVHVMVPPKTCVYNVQYEWSGIVMLDLQRGIAPKACKTLSGWLNVDEPMPSSHFKAQWTDELGKEHHVSVDVRNRLAAYDIAGSNVRLELSPEGVRVFIAEVDKQHDGSISGFRGHKPETFVFLQNN